MAEPWDPEFELDEAMAAKLVESQFPELSPVAVEFLGAGWDNSALQVNGAWVFRFPKRRLAVDCMRAELSSLPHLSRELELEVPRLRFVGAPTEQYPAPFAGYRRLEGITACRAGLTEDQRAAAAPLLGAFLARLHATELGPRERAGIPFDRIRRADLAYRRGQVLDRLARLEADGVELDHEALRGELDRLAQAPSWAGASRLVHGDLYPRHLLVAEDGQVTGVIDWGDVHRGDPALDLSLAFTFLPESARSEFERAYGGVDQATRNRARFRGLLYGVLLLTYGRTVREGPLERLGRQILLDLGREARLSA